LLVIFIGLTITTTTSIVQPLYRSTDVSRQIQLNTEGFRCSKFYCLMPSLTELVQLSTMLSSLHLYYVHHVCTIISHANDSHRVVLTSVCLPILLE